MASQSSLSLAPVEDVAPRRAVGPNDNEVRARLDRAALRYSSALPVAAAVVIEPDPFSAHPGRARRGRWVVRFKERHGPRPDPL